MRTSDRPMCRPLLALALVAAAVAGGAPASAQTLKVTGTPGLLSVASAVAGSAPLTVSDASTTYTIHPTVSGSKIVASINAAMPANVTLAVTLAPPTGATQIAQVSLGTTAQDVVTGIPAGGSVTRAITYYLSATAAAGVVPQQARTVTFTVLQGP